MKSRRHPWTTAGDRSLTGHRSASRSVSHPAAAHTLNGVSDATPGSHLATPYGLRSATAGLPSPPGQTRAGNLHSRAKTGPFPPVEKWTTLRVGRRSKAGPLDGWVGGVSLSEP
jgi:hypothetical protein